MKRIAQGKCTKRATDRMIMSVVKFFVRKIRRMIKDGMGAAAVQCESFDSDSEIAMEKVFRIKTGTPGMAFAYEAIVRAKDSVIIRRLNVGSVEVGSSEYVRSPETHVPLIIGIPFRTRWRSHLLHLL